MSGAILHGGFHKRVIKTNNSDVTFKVPTRYIFLDRMVESGEAIVAFAHDRVTHKDVVIKKRTKQFSPVNLARRTHREFVLSQIVNHKNLISLLNAFSPDETFQTFSEVYFVIENVDFPLSFLIEKREAVFCDGEKISYIMYQLLCGIKHLHKTGIVHRDLNINNIMVNKSYTLKIIDLGLARQIQEDTDNLTEYICQRFYRAPEVVLGLKYDRKVDVWSAGCIFAEMLLGNTLFKSDERLHSLVQWTKIIEVIGSPNADFFNQIPIIEIREYVEKQPKCEVMPWEQLFPDSVFPPEPKNHQGDSSRRYPMCDPQNGRDLLSKMLIINPTLRISVDEALEHPYVMWKNDPGEKDTDTNPHRRYNGYIDNMNQTENEWKAIIFAEMKQYERDHDIFGTIVDAPECESCKKYRCSCAICSGMSVNLETP